MTVRWSLPLLLLAAAGARADTLILEASADSTLYQAASQTAEAADSLGPNLFLGRIVGGLRRRVLLRFDLTTLPAGATIDDARLELTVSQTISGAVSVAAHRVTTNWQEGTAETAPPLPVGQGAPPGPNDPTWTLSAFPATAWTTAGGDFAPIASGAFTLDGVGDYPVPLSDGMLADVVAWSTTPATNLGWVLVSDETQSPPTAKRIGSAENTNAAIRPRLVVEYTPFAPPPVIPAVPVPLASPWLLLALALLLWAVALRSR